MRPIVNLPKEDRATDIAIGNMHKNLVKIARVVLEISSRTDRQTYRQTDILFTILRNIGRHFLCFVDFSAPKLTVRHRPTALQLTLLSPCYHSEKTSVSMEALFVLRPLVLPACTSAPCIHDKCRNSGRLYNTTQTDNNAMRK